MSESLLSLNSCESAGKAADEGNAITEEKAANSAAEVEQDRKHFIIDFIVKLYIRV